MSHVPTPEQTLEISWTRVGDDGAPHHCGADGHARDEQSAAPPDQASVHMHVGGEPLACTHVPRPRDEKQSFGHAVIDGDVSRE